LGVIGNWEPCKIFGHKTTEVTREWRRLHSEGLQALYFSPNIVRVITSRRVRQAVHVARMGNTTGPYRILMGKPDRRNHLEDPGVDGRIILKWIFKKCVQGLAEMTWLRIGTGGGLVCHSVSQPSSQSTTVLLGSYKKVLRIGQRK
jgi:hypothetical protein